MRPILCDDLFRDHEAHEWISPETGLRMNCPGVVEDNGLFRRRISAAEWIRENGIQPAGSTAEMLREHDAPLVARINQSTEQWNAIFGALAPIAMRLDDRSVAAQPQPAEPHGASAAEDLADVPVSDAAHTSRREQVAGAPASDAPMIEPKEARMFWWCTPCNAWRKAREIGRLGPMCSKCGSGRIRPPMHGEEEAARLASAVPLRPDEIKAALDGG